MDIYHIVLLICLIIVIVYFVLQKQNKNFEFEDELNNKIRQKKEILLNKKIKEAIDPILDRLDKLEKSCKWRLIAFIFF